MSRLFYTTMLVAMFMVTTHPVFARLGCDHGSGIGTALREIANDSVVMTGQIKDTNEMAQYLSCHLNAPDLNNYLNNYAHGIEVASQIFQLPKAYFSCFGLFESHFDRAFFHARFGDATGPFQIEKVALDAVMKAVHTPGRLQNLWQDFFHNIHRPVPRYVSMPGLVRPDIAIAVFAEYTILNLSKLVHKKAMRDAKPIQVLALTAAAYQTGPNKVSNRANYMSAHRIIRYYSGGSISEAMKLEQCLQIGSMAPRPPPFLRQQPGCNNLLGIDDLAYDQ